MRPTRLTRVEDYTGAIPIWIGYDVDDGYEHMMLPIVQAFSDVMFILRWVLDDPGLGKQNFFNQVGLRYFAAENLPLVREIFEDILGPDRARPGTPVIANHLQMMNIDTKELCDTEDIGKEVRAWTLPVDAHGKSVMHICDRVLESPSYHSIRIPDCSQASFLRPSEVAMSSRAEVLLHEMM